MTEANHQTAHDRRLDIIIMLSSRHIPARHPAHCGCGMCLLNSPLSLALKSSHSRPNTYLDLWFPPLLTLHIPRNFCAMHLPVLYAFTTIMWLPCLPTIYPRDPFHRRDHGSFHSTHLLSGIQVSESPYWPRRGLLVAVRYLCCSPMDNGVSGTLMAYRLKVPLTLESLTPESSEMPLPNSALAGMLKARTHCEPLLRNECLEVLLSSFQ